MNRNLYSLLFYLGLPCVALRLWWRGRKAPAYRRRIGERFALGLPQFRQGGIWLHAVSVGESIAAAPVVRALQQRYPDLPVTITCMTPTGSERIRALFGDSVQHCYLPYDLPCRARKFLTALKPVLGIVMETELWPNHIHQCARMNVPVVLANARLSERSARGYARFPRLTAPMLAQLSGIAVQTRAEAGRFLQLGARPETVQVTGSIKFDLHIQPQLLQTAQQLREQWQLEQRKVWIAGSTHEGEDLLMLEAHQQLLQAFPEALLILVPRHPERFDTVYRLCRAQGLEVMRRSSAEPVSVATRVLLGDTMGGCCCSMRWPMWRWWAAAWCLTAGTTCWSRWRWASLFSRDPMCKTFWRLPVSSKTRAPCAKSAVPATQPLPLPVCGQTQKPGKTCNRPGSSCSKPIRER